MFCPLMRFAFVMTFAKGLAVGVADAASDVPLEGTPDRMSRM